MNLELLVAALNADVDQLINKMQIETDAIIINQCDKYTHENKSITVDDKERLIDIYNMDERGVGLSRNNALTRATKDIILFSDEDIEYVKGYEKIIINEFQRCPQADILLFQVEVDAKRRTYNNTSFSKVNLFNCGRYPAYSMAIRREKLHKSGVMFSLLFGGGAKYSNGEDSLFIRACIKAGLKTYRTPLLIGKENIRESTWFKGYTEKFFFDRGVLFHFLYGKAAYIWAIRFILCKKKVMCNDISAKNALQLIFNGIKEGVG